MNALTALPMTEAGPGGRAAMGPPRWAVLRFLVTAALYLYLVLFVLPRTPIYRDGDGDLYLASARGLFDGEEKVDSLGNEEARKLVEVLARLVSEGS
jgi:hypothetical protein